MQVGNQPPPPPPPPPPPAPAPIQPSVDISADDTSINFKGNTLIRWTSNSAVVSCQASGGSNNWSGLRPPSGSFFTGNLTSDKTYNITCFNSAGASDFDSVTINVDEEDNDNGNVSVDIRADDTSIDEGNGTRVRWESDNADFCEGDGGANGWNNRDLDTDGSFNTGDLSRDTIFRITCFDDNGDSDSDSVTINVDEDNNNDSGNVSVDIRADDTSIDFEGFTRIRWESDNADFCEGDGGANGWNNRDLDENGSFNTGSLTRNTTFRITCENDDGDSDSDSVTIRVGDEDFIPSDNAPTAVTTSAINITTASAQLNSLILNSSTSSATAWFEWGTTPSLGFITLRDSVGTAPSVIHSATITGLLPGRIYYYRASAENTSGRSNGSILSFITNEVPGVVAIPPAAPRTTTIVRGVSTSPLVMLTIDGGAELITVGERRYYQVTWENVSSQTLEKVVLRVLLPQTMVFEGANRGEFSGADNSLNLDIGTLRPGEGDDLFMVASAGRNIQDGELIVIVANLIYTDPSGLQGDALAYATHRMANAGSVLGASALFGGDFLPNTFFGWLVLLILLLILIALIRHLYNQFTRPKPTPIP
ncbi:hypothetical protein A2933_01115 [Candidatus Nomurabacteria bacterium RIFCSPLOWO2_01_FULL_46_18]|uniref:Fibronectin type-III domain-containing protein n=1 Tax=Candidatus Nomurabacteria bacterium RIFCSPLOWO2_01_FULL_46_18 TaxID=1801783 RepID=A0A1F6XE09_9BACT|nr:MAG: hypothetical protein A2933_01115 [Candidatus Nomurabacteria bacterium RIFCSPLOWO2_01_FULL_46_18]